MFKLESYIAPILLSYVDKYIKNFRLEDSQVSLWGGDASFLNLDLRLEVLEQELQSPFSFISGHIRELLIHVPWTKLTSEPITITINTIECVLKLKDANDSVVGENSSPAKDKSRKPPSAKQEVEAPPNYVQLLINKIVNNIRIYCNNLILKYVEEDIVLSMNVKHLKVESCNDKWEAAYTDLSHTQVIMRKVIGVNDLTVCLDKRNTAGKIDVYQEPMLYRCSMTMHLLRTYHSATSAKTSLTRIDVYCNNMEFSMTEQQVPMFLRLLMLLYALQQKQLKPLPDSAENLGASADSKDSASNAESWTGWAWSYVSSVLPSQWDESWENQALLNQSGHIVQVGFYVDNMSLTFKLSDTSSDNKGYYSQKKVRYCPLITLQLQGIYMEMVTVGKTWFNLSCGVSEMVLLPIGNCSCSYPEVSDEPVPYLTIGCKTSSHKSNSLFDVEAVENSGQGQYRTYNTNWDFHMFTITESVLLERSPAFACDYLYQMEIPEDTTSEVLSELCSNLEFSNLAEKGAVRMAVAPMKLMVSSGLFHRINTLKVAASTYDYAPYYVPKPDPPLQDLLPPSEEDFDALNEFIPSKRIKIMFFQPIIELQFMDHPDFKPAKKNLFKKGKKHSRTLPPLLPTDKLPKITVECKSVEINMINPIYLNRLIHTTCQLPEPPKQMFEACFYKQSINVVGLCSRFVVKPDNHTMLIVPFNVSFESRSIIKPQYWLKNDVIHSEIVFNSENFIFNCTKAKLIVVTRLIYSVLDQNTDELKGLRYTSLLYDAIKDCAKPYLELCVEGLKVKKVTTNSTVSLDIVLESVKAFIFESGSGSSASDIQQVLFLSGPEPKTSKLKKMLSEELPLFTATVQYPLNSERAVHPSLVVFNLQEINVCVDPLVCKWLLYQPIEIAAHKPEERALWKAIPFTETFGSVFSETPRRTNSKLESVHSSSDRELLQSQLKLPVIEEEEMADVQEQIYDFLKSWHSVWKGMLLSGHISQCTIYFPTSSISAVGSQGVEQAVKEALDKELVNDVMVITLPFVKINSSQKGNIVKYLKNLPVQLPDAIWTCDTLSFPWTVSISDLNCYSLERGKEMNFLKSVGLSATIGLSTKSSTDNKPDYIPDNASMGTLGVYIHIDITPISVSVSEAQMRLLASLIYGLSDFVKTLSPKSVETAKSVEIPQPTVGTIPSPSLSPTAKETTLDNTSETIAEQRSGVEIINEHVKLTAWIQWTITKFTIELLTNEPDNSDLKLVVDVEDIVSSLDYQNVYLKLKSKIGSIAVQHWKRGKKGKWQAGQFGGIVMRLRDDVPMEKRPEDSGFIGLTITRASSQHTHNLWGALQKSSKENRLVQSTTTRYITEIVIGIQPIDFVISLQTLMKFYLILTPFIKNSSNDNKCETPTAQWFTNQALPLTYLECSEIRVILPAVETVNHDVLIVQIEKITLSPSVVNPICRNPIRPDIYRHAAQARLLAIPGSELEDRQYQLDVVGMAVSTSTWKDLEQILNIRGGVVRGINENPALEWNNLEQGKLSIIPTFNMKQIAEKFDITVVAAPTMIFKNDIVCSNSFEVNFVSDISIFLSLDQIKLTSALINELFPAADIPEPQELVIRFPYSRFNLFNDEFEEELTEFYRDSGIDTSEIHSVLSSKSVMRPVHLIGRSSTVSHSQYCPSTPFEALITAGKISLCLYHTYIAPTIHSSHHKGKKAKIVDEEDKNYEASEEESVDEAVKSHQKYIPLLFVLIAQPNAYSSTQQFTSNTRVTCFDFCVKLADQKLAPITSMPTSQNFTVDLLVTRSGCPDSLTGIPPSFLTVKFNRDHGKAASVHVEMARPTKIACSNSKINALLSLKSKIVDSFPMAHVKEKRVVEFEESSLFRSIKDYLRGIDLIQLQSDQLVFTLEGHSGVEMNLTVGQLKNRLISYDRPEKIHNSASLGCIAFSITNGKKRRLVLNPWTVTVEVTAFMESWQHSSSSPQVHLFIDSDCVILDVSPEQINAMEKIVKELSELNTSPLGDGEIVDVKAKIRHERDQHYKDDLRAGAFQFIEANNTNGEELPLPYQVMFWNYREISAMAWRYPQPRALTKVRIFPVPLEISMDPGTKISCKLQYWSDHHRRYISYSQFNLSESEVCYLDLPKNEPQHAVAYIWRVILNTVDENGIQIDKNYISPRALAACMRIDSYFNKNIVPSLTITLHVTKIELALFSNFHRESTFSLPGTLQRFSSDLAIPESHCFARIGCEQIRFHLASWTANRLALDLSSTVKCSILDYMFLTEQTLFEPFAFKLAMNLSKKLCGSFVADPIRMLLGPNIAHTLSVNSQIWLLNSKETVDERQFVVFTRYVVCNDTNVNLRFGQVLTDEDILLPSRCFHLYCWRSSKYKRKLKVAFEERGWIWSKPFRIDTDGIQTIHITMENNLSVIVTVKSLSATQKQIVIGGQFLIANMLLEHFDFKILPETKDELKKTPVHVLGGKTITPSMFLNCKANYFLRLRFFGLDSAWTGDIPLKEHTKGAQPWLVKVPLQERGQFLSIWCRIVVQDCQKGKRILAMLWPLFTVKSNLPVTSKIHIVTPTLNVHLDSSVKGKGELQQLYCPGTIDHSHQLTFKLDDGTSISDAYIPLNYSLVDQQKFFKRADKENIDEIVDSLRAYDDTKWPYFGDDLENVEWIAEDQPQTTIQVRYENACEYSSALMVELVPWCLMVNTFGCPISLMVNGTELCRIPQYGIVAPPKLDDTFHLGIDAGNGWSYSGPLQLATSDWSQAFYMPKITGTLPLEGNIKTAVKCGNDMCMVSITSLLSNEIRLLKVSSTHIFSNHMTSQIHVVCLAVPEVDTKLFEMPKNLEEMAFSVAPQLDKSNSAISIIRWYNVDSERNDVGNSTYALYISFCFMYKYGWSGPVRVDDNVTRRSLSVTSANKSIPLVLISQERKGQIYLSLYHDDCPQTLIENKSAVTLYCAQSSVENNAVTAESPHFNWFTELRSGTSTYYTMPFVSLKFPELPQTSFSEKILFALKSTGVEEELQWSTAVSITNDLEMFVKIPTYGDVKLIVKVTTFTTLLSIESVSQVEISALDIRGRLSRHEMETVLGRRGSMEQITDVNGEKLAGQSSVENKRPLSENLSNMSLYKSLFVPTIPLNNKWEVVEISAFVKSFSVVFLENQEGDSEKQGVASFTFDEVGLELQQIKYQLNSTLYMGDMQFDNLLYSKESYDFPVVIVSQESKSKRVVNIFEVAIVDLMLNLKEESLVVVDLNVETWRNSLRNTNQTGVKEVRIRLNPLSCYIEDLYINKLVDYFNTLLPAKLNTDLKLVTKIATLQPMSVKVPEVIFWESSVMAKPLNLKNITIEPLSLLLSIHCSVKMYIALDQSPLQFGRFERRRLLTTPYRLGHAMTMHYLSGAIFGAGWVVSSLELLGSPSGLARAMGTGLRDFVSLPYRGLVQGPWAFLIGVTHGSASLMKHVTAGTLQSVTKLASSVARNLDRLTLDDEHLRRTEEQRRQKPQGLTQGFMQGLTGLGISLLGAVGGIAHHPLQSIMADGASPRSLAAGVGVGLVGVITKPLSGAAELVALTGQGLLQGAGWNSLPQPRNNPLIHGNDPDSLLKYEWKLWHSITYKNIYFMTEATVINNTQFNAVALILTSDALIIASIDEDVIKRIIGLGQLQIIPSFNDPTLLSLKVISKVEEESVEMDPACRARVADYVRSTASLLQLPNVDRRELSAAGVSLPEEVSERLNYYVNPQNRNYFICLLSLAKQKNTSYNFPVL